jgi:hypothetical protein
MLRICSILLLLASVAQAQGELAGHCTTTAKVNTNRQWCNSTADYPAKNWMFDAKWCICQCETGYSPRMLSPMKVYRKADGSQWADQYWTCIKQ